MSIPEPQRTIYVKQVVLSLIQVLEQIMALPKIQQAKAAQEMFNELKVKAPAILPAILYTVKRGSISFKCPSCGEDLTIEEPDFRAFYTELMAKSGNHNKAYK